jgi:hypothetical protein
MSDGLVRLRMSSSGQSGHPNVNPAACHHFNVFADPVGKRDWLTGSSTPCCAFQTTKTNVRGGQVVIAWRNRALDIQETTRRVIICFGSWVVATSAAGGRRLVLGVSSSAVLYRSFLAAAT